MKFAVLILSIMMASVSYAKGTSQNISLKVTDTGFEPSEIKVKPGTNVVLNVTRTSDTTCATAIKIKEKNLTQELPLNKEVKFDLGTLKKGQITFACGMDMITGHVVAE